MDVTSSKNCPPNLIPRYVGVELYASTPRPPRRSPDPNRSAIPDSPMPPFRGPPGGDMATGLTYDLFQTGSHRGHSSEVQAGCPYRAIKTGKTPPITGWE